MSWSCPQDARRVAAACGVCTITLAGLTLVGWATGSTTFTSLRAGYKAIAPSITISIMVLGVLLLRLGATTLLNIERMTWATITGLIALFGLVDAVSTMLHADLNYEDAGTLLLADLLHRPFTPMSPIAGALLAMVGIGLVLLLQPRPVAFLTASRLQMTATLLAVGASLGGTVFLLGYLFREPFMYGSGWIPIAAPAAAGFVLLGTGTAALAGPEQWPVSLFVGPSTRARLVRAFVPLVSVAVLASISLVLLYEDISVNHAVMTGLITALSAAAAILVCSYIARGIGRDIDSTQEALIAAEHQQAELARLLDTIIENTEAHLVYLDRDFNFIRVNSTYARTCGYTPDQMAGLNHFQLYPHAENEAIFRRVRDTGQPFLIREKPFEFPDQPERGVTYWDWTLTPVKDETGEVRGLVFALDDVTEAVQQRERLLEVERARSRLAETMASEIAHRTKNNLQIVAGLLQIQLDSRVDPSSLQASLLRDTITRIHTFSVLQDQMHRFRADTVEVKDALQKIADVAYRALSAGDVSITVEGDAVEYPARVGTDLCVVANELITNALKHGGPGMDGHRRVRLRVARSDDLLTLSVWNSGHPVAADFNLQESRHTGMDFVTALVEEQYGGAFTLHPLDGGTLAEITLDDRRLREEAA